jgi:hypothetical protein
LQQFGLRCYGYNINRVRYDDKIEAQIATQQQAIMDVQTAMAEAKKAEQRAITAQEQGKAEAATSKWKQEVIRAQVVTEAEQKKDIAKLNKEAAEFYKQEQILRGEGDSRYKEMVMAADGALTPKLEAYEKVMGRFAQEFAKQKWVPEVQFNSGGAQAGGNEAANLISLLTAKTLKDLGLDLSVPKGQPKK